MIPKKNKAGGSSKSKREDPKKEVWMKEVLLLYVMKHQETKDSWAWLLELLVQDLGGKAICKHITFISY